MARLRFNIPTYRPAANAPLSEVPDAPDDASCGWFESSRDLQDGVMISEWDSLEDFEQLRAGA